MLKLFPSFLLCSIFFCSPLFALTIGVPGAKPTIQAGIDAASPGDTILVQPGTYYENIDFKGKNIVVGSMWLATRDSSYIINTIINAQQMNTVVAFKNGETDKAELCGFTLTNGKSQANVMTIGNIGGGIYCINSSPYLHHLIVDKNVSQLEGGGMYLENSNSVIEDCVIRNNGASMGGGGLELYKGNYKINNCIFSNNGGSTTGINCSNSEVTLFRVLLYKNLGDEVITTTGSVLNIVNCTIADNYNYTLQIFHSDVNIINSVFWNRSSPQIRISNGHPELPISHVRIAFSNIMGGKEQIVAPVDSLFYENNNINEDPLFKNISSGDFTLSKNSPCIDMGTTFFKIGDTVIVNLNKNDYLGRTPDMGYFESNYTTIVNENSISSLSLSNFPNPFNSKTNIHYSISKPGNWRLSLYAINGQKVIDLCNKYLSVGNYRTQWDGKDNHGNIISSNVYIIFLTNGIDSVSKSIVFLK
jgi:hypothetical protein